MHGGFEHPEQRPLELYHAQGRARRGRGARGEREQRRLRLRAGTERRGHRAAERVHRRRRGARAPPCPGAGGPALAGTPGDARDLPAGAPPAAARRPPARVREATLGSPSRDTLAMNAFRLVTAAIAAATSLALGAADALYPATER